MKSAKSRGLRRGAAGIALAAAAVYGAGTAHAAEFRWTNTSNVEAWFDLGSNWALNSGFGFPPPGAADDALFNQSATYNVDWDSFTQNVTNTNLRVTAGNVTFRSIGGPFSYTLTGNGQVVGGTLNLGSSAANPHILQVNGSLFVDGGGTFNIRFGSQANLQGLWVGGGAASSVVVDGAGSTLNLTGFDQRVGVFGGTGSLTFQNGAGGSISSTLGLANSMNPNSVGNLSVLSGSSLTVANLTAGTSGLSGQSGTISLQGNGSSITQTGASTLTLGAASTSPGTLNIGTSSGNNATIFSTGTGSITINPTGRINIGGNLVGQIGTLNANGNITINGGMLTRGTQGVFNLAAGRNLTASNNASVSFAGSYRLGGGSTFTIQSGSSFSTTQFLDIGGQASSNGTLIVTGAGSTLNATGVQFNVIGGSTSTGTLTLQNNAVATYNGNIHLGHVNPASTGNLNVQSGAQLTVPSLYVGGSNTTAGGTGTVNINSTGKLNVGGTMRVWGGGTVTLDNTFFSEIRTPVLEIAGGTVNLGASAGLLVSNVSSSNSGVLVGTAGGSGTLSITGGGTLNNGAHSRIGDHNSTGQATVSGAGSSWTMGGTLRAGYRTGNGTLLIQNGGTVSSNHAYLGVDDFLGFPTTGTGQATVTGAGSTWTSTSGLGVGFTSNGILTIENGGQVNSGTGWIGYYNTANGTVTLTGAGSQWNNTGSLYVGGSQTEAGGQGTVNVQSGGALFVGDTLRVWNNGEVNLSGASRTVTPRLEIVGGTLVRTGGQLALNDTPVPADFFFDIGRDGGTGVLHISTGGSLSSGHEHVYMALHSGSTGMATVTGAGSSWTIPHTLYVGHSGSGSLMIEAGGTVTQVRASIGRDVGSSGIVTVGGMGSTWSHTEGIYVGGRVDIPGGTATLNINGGASVNAGGLLRVWDDGVVNYNGGTILVSTIDLKGGGRMLYSSGGDKIIEPEHLMIDTAGGSFIDLSDNLLRVEETPLAQVHAYVASGYAAGAWNGPGINSSAAAAQPGRALGVAESGGTLVRFTWAGDATLDGQVTIADLGVLAANWQQTGRFWYQGDFNFDGNVTIADLGILAANWQKGVAAGGMSFPEAMAMFDVFNGVEVPEPGVVGLLGMAGLATLRRRR